MNTNFSYIAKPFWPSLSWLAICKKDSSIIYIHHGSGVEVKTDWFCEAVWDGPFENGDFDQTDIVFGSGGRIRDGLPIFVTSTATCDRLQFIQEDEVTYISNSLACLKAFSKGWPDINVSGYRHFFLSIEDGIFRYKQIVPNNGPCLAYFHNLTWDGSNIAFSEKPHSERYFTSYETYLNFVQDSLSKIGSNLSCHSRSFKLSPIGNVSSGYDSAASSALARSAGLKEVITFSTARGEIDDDGSDIAGYLGLDVKIFDRLSWPKKALVEVPFLAADGEGGELLYTAVGDTLKSRVMFTGNHGDKMWDDQGRYGVTPDILGGGQSGLSIAEYRLLIGLIHVPVPYIGIRHIYEVNVISNRDEMKPWSIGGDYNRPICRRILEEAGVPRHLFGQEKKATATLFRRGDVLLTRSTRRALINWAKENSLYPIRHKSKIQVCFNLLVARWVIPEIWSFFEKSIRLMLKIAPQKIVNGVSWRLYKIRRRVNLSANFLEPFAFPWAIKVLSNLYKSNS